MVEIPAARPVDRVPNTPALGREALEHPPNVRLGLGAHSTARGQTQRVTTRQREHTRQKQEHKRQPWLARAGDEHSGRERESRERAT